MVLEIKNNDFSLLEVTGKKLIKFYAPWCSPCMNITGPLIEKMSEELNDVSFFAVNVDENTEVAEKYDVMKLPVFVLERIKIDDELVSDYSFMVFPIFRGLEGCIKEIFFKFGINIGNNIGGQFQDHTNSGQFALIEKVKKSN